MFNAEHIILVLLAAWFVNAALIIFEERIIRVFVYFGILSLFTSVAYLLLGAPDVAMTEAAINAFVTVFFVVCFERYFSYRKRGGTETDWARVPQIMQYTIKDVLRYIPAGAFCIALFFLFMHFVPTMEVNTHLKDLYIAHAAEDVGGTNVIGAIYLGYRVYDTLFEALVLVISVVAVIHVSAHSATTVAKGRSSRIQRWGGMAVLIIRIISPIMILFGIYVIANGHLTAGGGFQGGLAVAAFFICRYMIYDIYDLPIKKVMKYEEGVFLASVLIAIVVVFADVVTYSPIVSQYYLIIMNVLIGAKVTCSFVILFYRFIAIERMEGIEEVKEESDEHH